MSKFINEEEIKDPFLVKENEHLNHLDDMFEMVEKQRHLELLVNAIEGYRPNCLDDAYFQNLVKKADLPREQVVEIFLVALRIANGVVTSYEQENSLYRMNKKYFKELFK